MQLYPVCRYYLCFQIQLRCEFPQEATFQVPYNPLQIKGYLLFSDTSECTLFSTILITYVVKT